MAEYLSPSNWDKRQPGRRGKSEWIKDYTDKDGHEKYDPLTFFERQTLDGIRRLRGRFGENVPNDPEYIARSLHAVRTDRPHIRHAVSTLITRGLLVVTNQAVDSLDKEKETDKEEEKKKPSARSASQEPVIEQPKRAPKPKPEAVFDKAYACYPRHVAKQAAEKAWGQAINREVAKGTVQTYAEHEDFIYQRVMHYGAVMRRKLAAEQIEQQFIPHMSRWLNAGRFLDDPSEWEVTRQEQRNGNGAYKTAGQGRNNRNLRALVLDGMGPGISGNDVPDGRTVQPGIAARIERPGGAVAAHEVLEGKPEGSEPNSDARRAPRLHGV